MPALNFHSPNCHDMIQPIELISNIFASTEGSFECNIELEELSSVLEKFLRDLRNMCSNYYLG